MVFENFIGPPASLRCRLNSSVSAKKKTMKKKLLKIITEYYLASRDFNGLPYERAVEIFDGNYKKLHTTLKVLIEKNLLIIMYGDCHPNPHILAFSDQNKDIQLQKLNDEDLVFCCLYPSKFHLKGIPLNDIYSQRPYSAELALGYGQLEFKAFDLSVLEFYRNDPRYNYENNDISGWISVHNEFYESEIMKKSDHALIESFGFCYSENFDRGVAVFLRYLHNLTPEHQQIWRAKEIQGSYKLHPDYYRNAILGEFGTRISIFDAFTYELDIINKMCSRMGKSNLFKDDYVDKRPKEFGYLLRPTLKEYNDFAHLVDKLMSDNIDKKFFEGELN